MQDNMGVAPSGPGHSAEPEPEPVPVPAAGAASTPNAAPSPERTALCRAIADRTVYKPGSDNYARVWQAAGMAFDRLQEDIGKLRADLGALNAGDVQCEACLAPLFPDDDYVVDGNGCSVCWPAIDDERQNAPCYAYRSLDRTVAEAIASGIEAAPADETALADSAEGESPVGEAETPND